MAIASRGFLLLLLLFWIRFLTAFKRENKNYGASPLWLAGNNPLLLFCVFFFHFYFVAVRFVCFLFLTLALSVLLCPDLIWQAPKVLIPNEAMTTDTGDFNFLPHSILVLFVLEKKTNPLKNPNQNALQESMVTRLGIVKGNNSKILIRCNECMLFLLWNMSHPLTDIMISLSSCSNWCHGYKTRIQGPLEDEFCLDFSSVAGVVWWARIPQHSLNTAAFSLAR